MKCPYCGIEMKNGMLMGDGRGRVHWQESTDARNLLDRATSSKKYIKNAKYSLLKFKIDGDYCSICKKIVMNVELS